MGFYSFQVFTKDIILIDRPIVQLGPGINVFCASVDDVEVFKQVLAERGAEVRKVTQLDAHEPVGEDSFLLPEERALLLGNHEKDTKIVEGGSEGEDS
jgi:hypothetical protein